MYIYIRRSEKKDTKPKIRTKVSNKTNFYSQLFLYIFFKQHAVLRSLIPSEWSLVGFTYSSLIEA